MIGPTEAREGIEGSERQRPLDSLLSLAVNLFAFKKKRPAFFFPFPFFPALSLSLPLAEGQKEIRILFLSFSLPFRNSKQGNTNALLFLLLSPSPHKKPKPNQNQSEVPLAAPPPFTLTDIKAAIPAKCFKKNAVKSMAYLAWDVTVVFGLAAAALAVNSWWSWPLYWIAQGTMFWALFVVGHDCGHQSFSNNRALNDFVGNITHASILVPYHGWRVSFFFKG